MPRMKAAVLYFVTAAATAMLVFYLVMAAIWGAPTSPLQYVSFGGSVVLALAAFFAPFRGRAAAMIALVGCLASWSFYAPALIGTFFRESSWWLEIGLLLSHRDYLGALGPVLAPLLLIASTVYAVRVLMRPGLLKAKS